MPEPADHEAPQMRGMERPPIQRGRAGVGDTMPTGHETPAGGAIARRVEEQARTIEALEQLIRLPDLPALFLANQSRSGTFQPLLIQNGTFGTYTGDLVCNDSSHASAMISLVEGQCLAMTLEDGNDTRVLRLPATDFDVYVTQNGGSNGDDGSTTTAAFPTYTYDVYLDAAKTIKIGATLAVEWHRPYKIAVNAGTHGRARWNGSTLVLCEVDEYFDRDACP